MDPSEIISTPYDLDRLNAFVMFPVTIILLLTLIRVPQKMLSFSVSLGRLTLVVYGLLGLCGAHIVENFKHSSLASLYIAALVSTTFTTDDVTPQILAQLPIRDHSDLLKTSRIFGTIVGCIPFQILSILDRGVQIQRWPLPIILGVTYGYVFGSIIGLVMLYFQRRQEQRQQERRRQ
jgi:hypothetical protein